MVRRALSWMLVVVVASTAGPLLAQAKSPLTGIPGDAALVVRVKGFQGLLKKVASLADAVKPGTGATVQFGGAAVGGLILNPTLDGVDTEGEFFLALFLDKEKAPGTVFLVPGKDLPAMKETLGDAVSFVEVGKHGVYSTDEELVNSVKEQLKSKEKDSLSDSIDAKSLAVLNRGDVSVFVNVPALLEIYKDEFGQAQGAIENIGNTERPENAPPGMNWEAIMGSVQTFVGKLVKAVEDHEGITVAFSFTEKDVVIENYFKLEADSESGKALKGGSGSDMPLLNNFPAGSVGYYSLHCDLNSMTSQLLEFSAKVIEDEKAQTALKDFVKEISSVKFNGAAGAFNLNATAKDGPGAFRMINIVSVSDPQKIRTLTKKYAESLKELDANNTKTEITYKSDVEKLGTTSIDHTISTITISDDAPDAEKQKKMIKYMYGEGPVTARTAYLKDKVVQTVGGGKAGMETALKSLESRTPATGLAAARSKLGSKPNFVGFIDLPNLSLQGMQIANSMEGGLPFDVNAIAEGLTLAPSYTGFAVEVEDAAVSLKTVVTLDQIKSFGQLIEKIMKAQQANN